MNQKIDEFKPILSSLEFSSSSGPCATQIVASPKPEMSEQK